MIKLRRFNSRSIIVLGIAGLLFAIVVLVLLATRQVIGRPLGIRNFVKTQVRSTDHIYRAISDRNSVSDAQDGNTVNIIFLHQSTGHYLIKQGQVREKFAQTGYNFWDHARNHVGLLRPDGSLAGYSYNIPKDNTYPDGLAGIFRQKVFDLPVNTLSSLLQYDVIAFKSCFPASHITSNEQLEQYKSDYLEMRAVMDQYTTKIFIVLTPPPLNPAKTNPEAALRAREFTNWLKSDEFLKGHPNIFTFDFFDYLAEDNLSSPEYSMLRQDYRQGTDSHPNRRANETIGPIFVDFVINAIDQFRQENSLKPVNKGGAGG